MLKIYNTLTRKKEKFVPVHGGKVGMYVCGLTVYSDAHIGHARTYVAFDVIRRYLEWKGYKVTYVQNITDVDDKIILAAQKHNSDPLNYAQTYSERCLADLDALGIHRADLYPKASEHIGDMIQMIEQIITNGYGYTAEGDVYFSVGSFANYGKLSGQKLDEIKSSGRISPDEKKLHPEDFALWKKKKPGEPSWTAPWGDGRPGWHIECSTMSSKYLGLPFDIHGGGLDLMFPHHENEIAQTVAATGKTFAKYWLHAGLLKINGEKMSKSLGNIVNIRDILKDYPPETLRFFYIQTHYRSPPDFTTKALDIAQEGLLRIHRVRDLLQKKAGKKKLDPQDLTDEEKTYLGIITKFRETFEKAMDDDFNTPRAIASIFDFAKRTNKHLGLQHPGLYQYAYETLTELGRILTLFEEEKQVDPTVLDALITLVREYSDSPPPKKVGDLMTVLLDIREKARAEKNWGRADDIRHKLENLNFEIQDTQTGTQWRIK